MSAPSSLRYLAARATISGDRCRASTRAAARAGIASVGYRCGGLRSPSSEEEEEEEEEGLFSANAVNEEDPERDRATQV